MDTPKYDFFKTFRFVIKIISNVFIVVFLLLIIVLALPYLLGLKPYYVMSGSMTNTIQYGSVVYVKAAEFDDIKTSDIATFRSKKDPGKSFTHRVVAVDTGARSFTTKGDANPTPDPVPVGEDQLVGKVVFSVPYAGYLSVLLKNKWFLLITCLVLLFWLSAEIELTLRKRRLKKQSMEPPK